MSVMNTRVLNFEISSELSFSLQQLRGSMMLFVCSMPRQHGSQSSRTSSMPPSFSWGKGSITSQWCAHHVTWSHPLIVLRLPSIGTRYIIPLCPVLRIHMLWLKWASCAHTLVASHLSQVASVVWAGCNTASFPGRVFSPPTWPGNKASCNR